MPTDKVAADLLLLPVALDTNPRSRPTPFAQLIDWVALLVPLYPSDGSYSCPTSISYPILMAFFRSPRLTGFFLLSL